MMKFTFSREVRLGEAITALAFAGGALGVWLNVERTQVNHDTRIRGLEATQALQVVTNREIRDEIRANTLEIKTDLREMRQEYRESRAAKVQVLPRGAM